MHTEAHKDLFMVGVHWSGRYTLRQMSARPPAFSLQFEHLSDDELQTRPRRSGGHGAIDCTRKEKLMRKNILET